MTTNATGLNSIKWSDTIIIAGLLIAIFSPLILWAVQVDKNRSAIENRNLSPLPGLPSSPEEFAIFPSLFNDYYSDHFGLRDFLTTSYRELKYTIGDQPTEEVLLGENEWMFLGKRKSKPLLDPVAFARNARLFTPYQLQTLAKYYDALSKRMQAQGTAYLLVISPSKSSIYFDQMPDYVTKVREQSATNQFITHIRTHTDVNIIDLRPPLIKASPELQLYFKADTHWNHHAANIAQFEIMQTLSQWFPGNIQPELFPLTLGKKTGGDLGNMTNVQRLVELEDIEPLPDFTGSCEPEMTETRDSNKRQRLESACDRAQLTLVASHDSFFRLLQPYFSRKFQRAVYIWDSSKSATVQQTLDTEKPDIFLEQWVERNLDYRMRKDPREAPSSEQGY